MKSSSYQTNFIKYFSINKLKVPHWAWSTQGPPLLCHWCYTWYIGSHWKTMFYLE